MSPVDPGGDESPVRLGIDGGQGLQGGVPAIGVGVKLFAFVDPHQQIGTVPIVLFSAFSNPFEHPPQIGAPQVRIALRHPEPKEHQPESGRWDPLKRLGDNVVVGHGAEKDFFELLVETRRSPREVLSREVIEIFVMCVDKQVADIGAHLQRLFNPWLGKR